MPRVKQAPIAPPAPEFTTDPSTWTPSDDAIRAMAALLRHLSRRELEQPGGGGREAEREKPRE